MMPEWMAVFEPLQIPAPPGWWPPAPGWWLLALLILAVSGLMLRNLYRRYRKQRYRRELEQELRRLWNDLAPERRPDAIPDYLDSCCALLRRTWLVVEPARASLPAPDLLESLEETPGIRVPEPLKSRIEPLLYGPRTIEVTAADLELGSFQKHLLLWARRHSGGAGC